MTNFHSTVPNRDTQSRALRVTRAFVVLNLLAAIAAVSATAWARAPLELPLLGHAGWGLGLRLDAISVSLYALVALVGAVVVRFSRSYFDGDPRRPGFLVDLCLTLTAVSLLVLAGNVLQLVLAWIGTSFGLNRLLLQFRDRPAVPAAAYKKFVVARLGDALLIGAVAVLVLRFETAEIGPLLAEVRAAIGSGEAPLAVDLAAILLVLAACMKSAQFPGHGWLIDMVEVPTPVSALLHAGLINAGGFLVIRFADVVAASPTAMVLLATIGALTAVFGSLVTLTQTSVKVSLAYSTVAQMGFMLLQCGLGAFGAALVHLVAHSLYKAHAFASSGSTIEAARLRPTALRPTQTSAPPRAWVVATTMLVACAAVLAGAWAWGLTLAEEPALIALGSILALGLTHVLVRAAALARGPAGLGLVLESAALAFAFAGVYFGLQRGVGALVDGLVPEPGGLGLAATLGMLALVLVFAVVAVAQWLPASRTHSRAWQRAYVALRHGLYVDQWLPWPGFAPDRPELASPSPLTHEPDPEQIR